MATIREVWRSFKSSVSTASAEQDFLRDASDMGSDRLENYRRAGDYYDGNHRVQLTSREKQFLQSSGIPYAENFCETIVDSKSGALRVRGFNSDDDGLIEFSKKLWSENRMDAGQKRVHRGAVKLGDYFVIVEPGDPPKLCPNHPANVKVVYDSDEPLYAVKVWNTSRPSASNPDGTIKRMNIYWPDSISKWYSESSTGDRWAAFREKEEDEGNTAFWTLDGTPTGEPIGIPVVHFANKPDPFYGVSKLRGVIPQQDALNKSLIDHFWVMDAQGWPQQFVTGTGSGGDIKRHPGSLWEIESEDAKVGQLEPADPEKTIFAIESQVKRMASRSNTPLHLMLAGGNLPSGETLKTSESGFIREGEDFQVEEGNAWEDTIRLAARIATAFNDDDDVSEDASLDCKWDEIETRNEVDEANVAVLKQTLGVSQDTLLTELGYDPKEEREKREASGEGAAAELLARAEAMQVPTRSEENGGGRQPMQAPRNRTVARQPTKP